MTEDEASQPICPEHHATLDVEQGDAYDVRRGVYVLWCAVTCPLCHRTVGLVNEVNVHFTWQGSRSGALEAVLAPGHAILREQVLHVLAHNIEDHWQHYDQLVADDPRAAWPHGHVNVTMRERLALPILH